MYIYYMYIICDSDTYIYILCVNMYDGFLSQKCSGLHVVTAPLRLLYAQLEVIRAELRQG